MTPYHVHKPTLEDVQVLPTFEPIPAGYRLARKDDVNLDRAAVGNLLEPWDVAKLADLWAIGGLGYGFEIWPKSPDHGFGNQIIVKVDASELALATIDAEEDT